MVNVVGNSCGKILRENLAGEILQENLTGKSCGKFLQEILEGNAVGNLVGNFVGNLAEKVLMVCNGSKMAKNHHHRQFLALAGNFFKLITTTKTLSNCFYLVEEVLSFDLVGHM